jgi:hypothetical protein
MSLFYKMSQPIVGPRGEVRVQMSADELTAYGVPEIATAAAKGKSFEHLGVHFEAFEMPDPPQAGEAASQAAIDSMARQNRLDRLWDVGMTAALAIIFTAIGLWGGTRLIASAPPCAPTTVLAQPTCDESTGVCR